MVANESEVKVRLYAAARAAVGVSEIQCSSNSAQAILEEIAAGNQQTLALFSRCSILVQGEQFRDREKIVKSGSVMDVLPPFAGGSR